MEENFAREEKERERERERGNKRRKDCVILFTPHTYKRAVLTA
jgi:hypothetical protein